MKCATLLFLAAALSLSLGCATTQSSDAGPGGPALPAVPAEVRAVAVVASGALPALAPLADHGAAVSAEQHQTVRCYLYSAAAALARTGGSYASQVATSGEWLSEFPEVSIDVSVCLPEGVVPVVSEETEVVVRKLIDQTIGPVVALTSTILGVAGLPCEWQAFATWIETEVAEIGKTVTSALAHPAEPWVLPALPMPTCPAESSP